MGGIGNLVRRALCTFIVILPEVNGFGFFYVRWGFRRKFNASIGPRLYFCPFMLAPDFLSPIKALSQLLILTGLCILGLFFFSVLGIFICSAAYGLSFAEIQSLTFSPEENPNARTILLIVQGFSALGSFIAAPLLLRFLSKDGNTTPRLNSSLSPLLVGLVIAIAFLMMPVNAWLAAWNASIHLPDFLKPMQDWAHEKEESLERITLFLVDFQTPLETFLGFLVVAVLAGVSEEYFFRKMLQTRFIALTRNPHMGIWLTAFLFAAIHVQFYGLIPRMLLGALFGYYFYWTGNIGLAMLGHILNNGITLVGVVLYQKKISPIDVDDPAHFPWYIGAVAAGITWSLAVMFKEEAEKRAKRTISTPPQSTLA